MLNEKVMLVFDAVMKYLVPGESVVIPKNDVKTALGTDFTQSEIDNSLNALQMSELIQVRYADNEVYCLSVLPKGIWENEKRDEMKAAERRMAELAAAEEAKRVAMEEGDEAESESEKENSESDASAIGEREEKPELAAEEAPQSKEVGVAPITVAPINIKTAAIICAISGFLGAFFAGIITMAVVIAKVG